MKIITYYTAIVVWALAMTLSYGQETIDYQEKINELRNSKEQIINQEKDALKATVEEINRQLDAGTIDKEEADRLKQEAAEKRALNIQNRVSIVDNQIALLERNKDANSLDGGVEKLEVQVFTEGEVLTFTTSGFHKKYDRRTTSDLVFAFGFNNVITEGESLNDSNFKIGGSRFAELGWAWKTRVFNESNWLRFKYGFSFQWNGLKPTNNRYYVKDGEQTVLETFPENLNKSKFRLDNLVFPVHFEFGPSTKKEYGDYFRYSTKHKLKVGLGGYMGFKLGARQKLKYKLDGQRVKEKIKDDFNTNNFVYGLSGYIGWAWAALYVKYDLQPIFKDNPVEQRNISLGLRFDVD